MAFPKYLISLALLAAPALGIKSAPRVCDEPAVFSVSRLDFASRILYSTPSHKATEIGNFSFVLSNSAGEYDLDCEATSTYSTIYFDGKKSYSCTPQSSIEPTPFSANFTFNYPSTSLTIDAKYGCYNMQKRSYDSFTAKVSGALKLNCEDRFWQNKNWTVGAMYSLKSTSCDTAYVELKPETKLTGSRSLAPPAPKAPAVPPKAPAVPAKAPAVPAKAPAVPAKAPAVPAKAPAVPAKAPAAPAPPPKVPAPAVVPPKVPAPAVVPTKVPTPASAKPTATTTAPPTATSDVDDDDDDNDDESKRRRARTRPVHT